MPRNNPGCHVNRCGRRVPIAQPYHGQPGDALGLQQGDQVGGVGQWLVQSDLHVDTACALGIQTDIQHPSYRYAEIAYFAAHGEAANRTVELHQPLFKSISFGR